MSCYPLPGQGAHDRKYAEPREDRNAELCDAAVEVIQDIVSTLKAAERSYDRRRAAEGAGFLRSAAELIGRIAGPSP